MFYVTRNASGSIASIARTPQEQTEVLEENHPEIQDFLTSTRLAPEFSQIDADFIRVIEDVVDTLIAKNVIRLTDLPIAAQQKMTHRQNKRSQIVGALNLLDTDKDQGIL
jgi:adenosine deaminase